jgi:para-nitrobenzyl esterase
MMAKSNSKAYLYYFTHVPPRPDAEKYGAYHAAEIVYAFDNLSKTPYANGPTDRSLAQAMSGCWVRFAATGDPNGGNLPPWKPYDTASEPYLEFGDAVRPGQHLLKAECDFYDAHAAAKRAEFSK